MFFVSNFSKFCIDFGGQYNQLIARRVRECNVYCEVHPYTLTLEEIKAKNPKGIIFTGGPNSVYEKDSPKCGKEIFDLGIPILGIIHIHDLQNWTAFLCPLVYEPPLDETEPHINFSSHFPLLPPDTREYAQ